MGNNNIEHSGVSSVINWICSYRYGYFRNTGVGVTAALGIRAVNVLLALIKAGSIIFGGKVFGAKRILDMLRNNYDILYDKNKSLLIRKL